jgi:hypothetical protein
MLDRRIREYAAAYVNARVHHGRTRCHAHDLGLSVNGTYPGAGKIPSRKYRK